MIKVTVKLQGDKCPCEIDMRGDPVQIIAETGYMLRGIYIWALSVITPHLHAYLQNL